LTKAEGKRQKVDEGALAACIAKQDETAVRASMKLGEELGVDSTPALFINGERVVGAVPMKYVFKAIDNALIASGQTPPPPPPEESAPATPAPATSVPTIPTPPATKPGN
jgi:hypothetical protein